MKTCQDIIEKMRAASRAKEANKFTKTLAGVSGTWFLWHLVDVSESGKRKG